MKKIIFDLDNTLLFISDEWYDVYSKFIEEFNLNTSANELYYAIGQIEKENTDKIITKELFIKHVNDKLSLGFNEEMYEKLEDDYARIPLTNLDNIKDLLSYLSNKYELIAYTNWFTDNQILRLKINGLDKYFSKVLGWDILPVKPSKKGIEEIIKSTNKEDYIIIGDNLDMDIKLPHSMGIKTIFYNYKNIDQDMYKEVKNIEDLKNIL